MNCANKAVAHCVPIVGIPPFGDTVQFRYDPQEENRRLHGYDNHEYGLVVPRRCMKSSEIPGMHSELNSRFFCVRKDR